MGQMRRTRGTLCCEVCGNSEEECFEIRLGGERHIFDSFECAMRAFQLRCENCEGEILGHGLQLGNRIYCSQGCASEAAARDYQMRAMLRSQSNL